MGDGGWGRQRELCLNVRKVLGARAGGRPYGKRYKGRPTRGGGAVADFCTVAVARPHDTRSAGYRSSSINSRR